MLSAMAVEKVSGGEKMILCGKIVLMCSWANRSALSLMHLTVQCPSPPLHQQDISALEVEGGLDTAVNDTVRPVGTLSRASVMQAVAEAIVEHSIHNDVSKEYIPNVEDISWSSAVWEAQLVVSTDVLGGSSTPHTNLFFHGEVYPAATFFPEIMPKFAYYCRLAS